MKEPIKEIETTENQDFISEYIDLFKDSSNSVTIRTEWVKAGDFFHKLSMYDDTYSPVKTLGNTTLIKAL